MINDISDVEFGMELDAFNPNTSIKSTSKFAEAVGWGGGLNRFTDHDAAKKEGLPGALVPGLLTMGFLTSMIHRWAPTAMVHTIDTVFRAPLLADGDVELSGVVTDIDEVERVVELDLSVKNAQGDTSVFGTAKVIVPAS
tara:strand:- start:256 stop:675 length:420 start_codon:yes stop_codon:yes gene_type:complete